MNRKHILAVLSSLPLVACLFACSSDNEESKAEEEMLNVEREVAFAATETSRSVKLTADCAWEVDNVVTKYKNVDGTEREWDTFSVSPKSGKGNSVLVISSEANHTSEDRVATFIIQTKGGLKQKVTVYQSESGADLSINNQLFDFDDKEGTQTLTVKCNTNWEILGLTGYDWLEIGQTSGGAGEFEIPIKVKEIFDDAERAALFVVSAGSLGDNTFDVMVTQSGKPQISLALSTYALPVAAAGGTQTITVTCDGAWSAAVPASMGWVSISPTSGVGNGEITVTCDPYTSTQERLTVLTVTAGTQRPQRGDVVITQSPN
jgi:hypothetical protein